MIYYVLTFRIYRLDLPQQKTAEATTVVFRAMVMWIGPSPGGSPWCSDSPGMTIETIGTMKITMPHVGGWTINWLVVTGTWILFSHILGNIIPIDFHIFQRGWNHQPDKDSGHVLSKSPGLEFALEEWKDDFRSGLHSILNYQHAGATQQWKQAHQNRGCHETEVWWWNGLIDFL